mmetsp:Transcript_14765/g.28594  ORF Transcript_14765/g.28594 Transcript_14765/m.28594 type:complete len:198 (-) Transcript_14765:96-689(-)
MCFAGGIPLAALFVFGVCFDSATASASLKEVIMHVQCDVCKQVMKEARWQVRNQSISEEDAMSDLVDNLCSLKKEEGKWIAKIDIVQQSEPKRLVLEMQNQTGHCRKECKAIQKSCAKVIKNKEESLVSLLLESVGLARLHNKICDRVCTTKDLPKLDSWEDEAFKVDKDAEIKAIMDKMKGMPGMENLNMYKPGEL